MSEPVRRIAVTGAAGYVGSRLIERLQGDRQVERIVALDIRPPKRDHGPKVVFLRHDVVSPFTDTLSSHGIEAVAHLAYALRPGRDRRATTRINVDGTRRVLDACAEARVKKVIYLSSTSVYGAHPDNPPMLTEDSPPRPIKGFHYSEDKVRSESLVREFAASRPGVAATILRCCPVVGPHADNFISRAFLKSFLVAVRGFDPPMQFIHEDDLSATLAYCLLNGSPGTYNLAGEGTIRWSEMAESLGRPLVSLPAPLLYAATDLAWALHIQSDSPSSGLSFIRYPWTASTDKIKRELGVTFRHSSREVWAEYARHHRHPEPTRLSHD
jgi:UDP-glucose 4-epimerase